MKKVWKIVKNRYFIAGAAFLVLFLFLDQNNLRVTLRLRQQVHQLEKKRDAISEEIARDSANTAALKDDPQAIERYGREKYYMKSSDEDIYIIQ